MDLIKIATVFVISQFLAACSFGGITPDDITRQINLNLVAGMSREQVSAFTDKMGWSCSYDRFSSRQNCIIRDPGGLNIFDRAIVINLFEDEMGKYSHAEIENSYTFL